MNLANIVYSWARWFGSLQTCCSMSVLNDQTLPPLWIIQHGFAVCWFYFSVFSPSLLAPVLSTHAVRFCQQETTNKRTSRNNKAWDLWRNWLFSNSNRKSLFDRAESEHWRKKKRDHTPPKPRGNVLLSSCWRRLVKLCHRTVFSRLIPSTQDQFKITFAQNEKVRFKTPWIRGGRGRHRLGCSFEKTWSLDLMMVWSR